MSRRRSAFTLIELMVVVAIMALMAGLVAMSVRTHIDRARWTRTFEQIEKLDRMARLAARREAIPYRLTFNRVKRHVELHASRGDNSKVAVRTCRLPAGIQFAEFKNRSNTNQGSELIVAIAPSGQSSTYAIGLSGSSGDSQWLVTLGFSGQPIRLENADDVDSFLIK